MIRSLREASPTLVEESRPWLVSFQRGVGIVKCAHRDKQEVIKLLKTIRRVGSREVHVRTLGTSGTVRKAMGKYVGPILSRREGP